MVTLNPLNKAMHACRAECFPEFPQTLQWESDLPLKLHELPNDMLEGAQRTINISRFSIFLLLFKPMFSVALSSFAEKSLDASCGLSPRGQSYPIMGGRQLDVPLQTFCLLQKNIFLPSLRNLPSLLPHQPPPYSLLHLTWGNLVLKSQKWPLNPY